MINIIFKKLFNKLNLINLILILTVILNNIDYLKIKIVTIEIKHDSSLVKFLKSRNSFANNLNTISDRCDCLLIYEVDVSESIRFKSYLLPWEVNSSEKLKNIISEFVRQEIKLYAVDENSLDTYLLKKLNEISMEVLNNRNQKLKIIALAEYVKSTQKIFYESNYYLSQRYIKENNSIDLAETVNLYPSFQIKLILNIIFIFIFIFRFMKK